MGEMTADQQRRVMRVRKILGLPGDGGEYLEQVIDALQKHEWQSWRAARYLNKTLDFRIAKL